MSAAKKSSSSNAWLTVPETFSAIMDGADDMDLAIYEIRQLAKLARDQCNIVQGSDAIATLIRAALRHIDDMEKNNQRLQETVRDQLNKLEAAGTPQIGGAV